MADGGYSTLERHEHVHAVMILRGRGQCLLGDQVRSVKPFDLITIPAWTWHQFRATEGEPLGFLCMVNAERDRPRLPSEQELAALAALPDVAMFLASQPLPAADLQRPDIQPLHRQPTSVLGQSRE